jgi:hypothetical protein
METAAFRLMILKRSEVNDLKRAIIMAVNRLAAPTGRAAK